MHPVRTDTRQGKSRERDIFEVHTTAAVAELNSWLDAENVNCRRLIRNIKIRTYWLGVLAVFMVLPSLDTTANAWQSSLLGALIGVTIAIITTGASFLLERSARSRATRSAKERDEAAAFLRTEALRQGERPPVSPRSLNHPEG